jgi:hypothetical protein
LQNELLHGPRIDHSLRKREVDVDLRKDLNRLAAQ